MSSVLLGINAYNEEKSLPRLLRFLLDNEPYPILIFNDGSIDKTKAIIERFQQETLRVSAIHNPTNQGYAFGFHTIIKNCGKDILVMMDADTKPEPGAISHLLEPFQDPEIGAVSGTHLCLFGNCKLINLLNDRTFKAKRLLDKTLSDRRQFSHLNGLLLAIRIKAYEDNHYLGQNQDAFIGWYIKSNGFRVVFEPKARSWFKPPGTVPDYLASRNRVIMGHNNLSHDFGIKEYYWSSGSFGLYLYCVLVAGKNDLQGLFSLGFGLMVDLFYRLKWFNLVRKNPGKFNDITWKSIKSTKW